MSKIYEVNATETVSGFFHVEAESAAEAAFLIDAGYAYYETYKDSCQDVEYHIDELREEETGHDVYDYDDHKAFEKAYYEGREFYKKQGQLDLGDAPNTYSGWASDAHDFALRYAREETGMGLAELADIGC